MGGGGAGGRPCPSFTFYRKEKMKTYIFFGVLALPQFVLSLLFVWRRIDARKREVEADLKRCVRAGCRSALWVLLRACKWVNGSGLQRTAALCCTDAVSVPLVGVSLLSTRPIKMSGTCCSPCAAC